MFTSFTSGYLACKSTTTPDKANFAGENCGNSDD